MRLRKIKLAGFKSFVDPTNIEFPSELIGVVGPNGCGKSNVIDAVRWVMGEISAKHLRGESMADVVFSGSTARKPVSQASVELVFDNSEGRLGGRYASYSEIAVKRQVTREASQSHYFLNGTRCRRRDVTDVFMGTGLGPRSYAIIEQGMISRLIEAKPEELREFLEEAAGISKYKERRRETENRISHARENMDRLNDLREELEQRLQHLKRQAAMAEKYKVLKREERLLRAELLCLRWRLLSDEIKGKEVEQREQETALEVAIAAQRRLENTLERQRGEHTSATDKFNEIYRQVLDAGAEIARIEATIAHLRSRRVELEEGLEREEVGLAEARTHLANEQAELNELDQALSKEQPELERLQEDEAGSRAEFGRSEEAMLELQADWESLNQRAARPSEIAHAERARITHVEQHIEGVLARIAKLEAEFASLRPDELNGALSVQKTQLDEREQDLSRSESVLQQKTSAIEGLRLQLNHASEGLNAARERFQRISGRLSSLQALQQEALGRQPGARSAWLEAHGLAGEATLAEQLEVEHGWERAVEAVLGHHLGAICVREFEPLAKEAALLEEGALGLFDVTATAQRTVSALERVRSPRVRLEGVFREAEAPAMVPIADKVKSSGAISTLLDGVFAVESIEEAFALRAHLESRESVISRDGVWLGPNWLRYARNALDGAGVLSREQEIKSLSSDIDAGRSEVTSWQLKCERAGAALTACEEESEALRKAFGEQHHGIAALRSGFSAKQTELEQARLRAGVIRTEISELREQAQAARIALGQARETLEQSLAEVRLIDDEKSAHSRRRQEHREKLESVRERWHLVRDDVYQVGVRAESMRTKLASLRAAARRNEDQVVHLEARCSEIRTALGAIEEPLHTASLTLESKLVARREVDQSLDAARESVEAAETALRESEQQRGTVQRKVEAERTTLEELRMRVRETAVRRSTLEDQLGESGHEVESVLETLPLDAEEQQWEERLARMDRRISRLGAINLAAIEEYDQESERKTYLDAQNDDLTEALETLEQAIRKIDRETRARFKDTYEKVNEGLSETFPRLFGGGSAFLQMTGEDLLSTGITVMARPPGKRNTSIHLLSGGEKALAAIALVFAIFELNPAPFCLLDEVDAPLDDANVVRFCELVKSMTERVQFLLVTHNKATMEMANQLIGVTMSEPGISRLVAVDVDEAVALAAV